MFTGLANLLCLLGKHLVLEGIGQCEAHSNPQIKNLLAFGMACYWYRSMLDNKRELK